MNTQRWQQIKEVLYAAVELAPDQRENYLDQVCGGDLPLRREVEALIEANDQAGEFLETPALGAKPAPEDLAGSLVGHYRIVGEIGRGGMAVVYRAVREDDFRQEVAVKVVKRGMDTDELLERFRHERQILALLSHNNIARVLDGGATADGRPYFVMELVHGLPITDYCDRNNLGIHERLLLFLKVCGAVEYAHRNLVVHRDLKPANILIGADGEPKLLDFGVAKLLSPDATGATAGLTGAQVRLLTPEYASPEQVRGERITTATDLYALGAVLYELLTGAKAHRLTSSGAVELERVICLTDPTKPSETGEKRSELRGDLDNIVLKALEKQPERRYWHAEQLAEDIQRYLDGRPVLARPDTIRYRTVKFCRRNKVLTISAVVVLLTLIGGIIATAWQARIAQRERAVAERRFDEVRKLGWTLLFEVDPEIAPLAGATKAREKLLSASIAYLDALARDAKGDPALLRELAEAYEKAAQVRGTPGFANLGREEVAVQNLRKAMALREQLLATDPSSIDFRLELARATRLLAQLIQDPAEARGLAQRALEMVQLAARRPPVDDKIRAELASAHYQVGQQLVATDPGPAIQEFRQALALYKDPSNVSLVHKKIGALLLLQRDAEHALVEYNAAIALDEDVARRDPSDARSRLNLSYGYSDRGSVLVQLQRLPEAIESYRKAEAIRLAQATADPSDSRSRSSLVSVTWRIGMALAQTDRRAATETLERAVRLGEFLNRDFPANSIAHRELLDAYGALANAYRIWGSCVEAQRWWELRRRKLEEWKLVNSEAVSDHAIAACESRSGKSDRN
ncbi:MAG: protein kinase [Acidobacteriia bacterium]|nr:protein kinase [Terriglobia bacterium]